MPEAILRIQWDHDRDANTPLLASFAAIACEAAEDVLIRLFPTARANVRVVRVHDGRFVPAHNQLFDLAAPPVAFLEDGPCPDPWHHEPAAQMAPCPTCTRLHPEVGA